MTTEAEKIADRAAIIGARPRVLTVPIDGIVGTVRVRSMRRSEWTQWASIDEGDIHMIAACLIDDAGNPLLTVDEVRELYKDPTLEQLAEAIFQASGMQKRGQEKN
jgi:hypothetical protein